MKQLENMKEIPVEKLIDLSLEVGWVPDAKFHYQWHEHAHWQLKACIEVGLKPEHKMLDIGCGPLRFGMLAMQYLDNGNYYGMDAFPPYIELGKAVFNETGIEREYHVAFNRNFEFEKEFGEKFDFANCQSVFTHLSKDQIVQCLHELRKVMNPGGKLLFTNIVQSMSRGFLYASKQPMITGTQLDDTFYEKMAAEIGAKYIKNVIEHPTQHAHILQF